ncbi:hypothetical protein TW79_22690 [Tritonibacter mobilis]|uniref:Uncharacterized protein n=1 Tax=Tritonibacter mobilis F1926 TaxID=1265309 RepID=A0A1B1A7S3_9RHOB|nr:hypothetical protein K529_017700 [Tritonibacter mobilis F1926]KJZ21398.1 hypothetical protein TW79_22690 [Tritonibacter mobilis]
MIGVGGDHFGPKRLGEVLAAADLIFDRGVTLQVRGIAGVDGGAQEVGHELIRSLLNVHVMVALCFRPRERTQEGIEL